MKMLLRMALLVLLTGVGLPGLGRLALAAEDVRPPEGFREVGGSNYVMYHVGTEYRVENQPGAWFQPGVLQPTIATFHRQPRQLILDQLKAMHDAGQRKIALLLWVGHTTPTQPVDRDGVYGHIVSINGGKLPERQQTNLRELLRLIADTGYFNQLDFRFAVQGPGTPGEWNAWNEPLYQEYWNCLASTRPIIEKEMAGRPMRLRYDLGAELGGLDEGQTLAYTRRLWADYTKRFGAANTYGFSIALAPGRIAAALRVYDEVGVRPEAWAIDLYTQPYECLKAAAAELRAGGIEHPKVVVQETYYNNPEILAVYQRAGREFGLDYLYLMQWPLEPGRKIPHFSMDFPEKYDAYLRPAAGR